MDIKQKIEQANQIAFKKITDSEPVLVDIAPAIEVIPGMEDKMVLHSGPPITWDKMCGAQRGAIIGEVLYEGWAKTAEAAIKLLESGEIKLEPNHHHQTVGPMAGTISANSWVYVVENKTFGNKAFCRQVEGMQQFGDYSEKALDGLRSWRDIFAPSLQAALKAEGELPLKPIITQALQMGDELHNRHSASSALFGNAMAIGLVKAGLTLDKLLPTLYLLKNHNLIFLGLAMAAGKAIADPARDVEYSTMVTAMCRNGTEFGIRVSGLSDEWFTAPAPFVNGLYVPGFSDKDAGFDMGDSAITETVGWGGFVLGGAPGILSLVGGTPEEALAYSREMKTITIGIHPTYKMPVFGFEGTPTGIDIRKVIQTNSAPIIDTAIAHKEPGYPKIGAGLVRAPMECFKKALIAFSRKYQSG
ncbi:MAG: YlbE family protein [Anaerolineaceae bacterium]